MRLRSARLAPAGSAAQPAQPPPPDTPAPGQQSHSDDFQKYVQRTLQVLETSSMKFCHILTANGM